jgi:hypothetical protein
MENDMNKKSIPLVIVLLSFAPSADAQIVSGLMGVTGAEMH